MTKPNELPSAEMLNKLLDYDADTGALSWRSRTADMFESGKQSAQWRCGRWNSRFAGKPAFTAKKGDGYRHTNLLGQWVTAHRVIWKMVYGSEPNTIDHINGNRSDNRIENLRSVTFASNLRNSARQSRYTNPYNGVRKTKNGKWQAYLKYEGKFVGLGVHETPELAKAARKAAEVYYGFHQNHGRVATKEN